MVSASNGALLGADDPPPFILDNPSGRSPFLLIGDHAGSAIPSRLGDLGVARANRERHIGWDIGVAALGAELSRALEAVFIRQPYSRLVIDCNRAPESAGAILQESDGTPVPGNSGLGPADRARRIEAIHEPYQAAIGAELERRRAARLPTILISLHSFTPRLGDAPRPWEIGVLHAGGDSRFAHRLLATLRAETAHCVGDNEPYRMDETDYTVPRHCFGPRLLYAELEVRQDLLGNAEDVRRWSSIIERALLASG